MFLAQTKSVLLRLVIEMIMCIVCTMLSSIDESIVELNVVGEFNSFVGFLVSLNAYIVLESSIGVSVLY